MNKQDIDGLNLPVSPRHSEPTRRGVYWSISWLNFWLHNLVKKQIHQWSIGRFEVVTNHRFTLGGSLFTNASIRRYNYIVSSTNPSRSCRNQFSKESR